MGTLRLTSIRFAAGSAPGNPPLEIKPATSVVLVGPNNSGKSLALREIESWCIGDDHHPRRVIATLEADLPKTVAQAQELLRRFQDTPPPGVVMQPDGIYVHYHTFTRQNPINQFQATRSSLESAIQRGDNQALRQQILAGYAVRLDGRTRFSLVDPKEAGDLQKRPVNHAVALFKDSAARERVRRLTADAFKLHFVVDPTGMSILRFRLSETPPSPLIEQSLTPEAIAFHGAARLISEFSDGVQSFVGLTSAILSLPHKVLLIDEPEAFLHPRLARTLGANLSRLVREREACMVVATHSSSFLLGCLQSHGDTDVIRLTFDSGVATARRLPAAEISILIRDPLLRSTGVLDALFHKAAVVVEADSDRAFYDEVNYRLLNSNRGIADTLFVNAQNKQTIHRIVLPLRRLGLPAAAIVDLDVIKDGSTWSSLLTSCGVPTTDLARLEQERAAVMNAFKIIDSNPNKPQQMKEVGVCSLPATERKRCDILLDELAGYGLFVVPVGEPESWLGHLGVGRHGSTWLMQMFVKMGLSETDPSYVAAGNGDVWEFVDKIAAWASNPARKGIPS